ncbi:MAG: hypothetical protein LBD38_00730 [Streptococcaceae bacterium]|jgi:predicted small secreted protein|nr:hypothetical protein [Streptococcaceae bacterium]
MKKNEEQLLGFGLGCGFAFGLVTGLTSMKAYKEKKLTSQRILKKVKKHFSTNGEIQASWIFQEVQEFQQLDLSIPVFEGGITRLTGEQITTYKFLADAKTGTLVHIEEVEEEDA